MDAPSIPAFSSVRWKNLCEFEALEIIPGWGRAEGLADPRQEVILRRREQGKTQEKLRGDAPEAPHVDRHAVRRSEDHLGGPIEPGLDVLVHSSVLEARAAKVDELDFTRVERLDQDVLGLQVAVNHVRAAQHAQRREQLPEENLTRDMDRPLKLFWRRSSYRLMFSTSNTMHRCDRCTKWSIIRTMCRSSL